MSAAIISLDQSKDFDRVSHENLFIISNEFPVQRSVRQGFSLSPLIYVLCTEPFAHRIRMDPMIKGISLPGTTESATICQYVDDTNLFISDTRSAKYILAIVFFTKRYPVPVSIRIKPLGCGWDVVEGVQKDQVGLNGPMISI